MSCIVGCLGGKGGRGGGDWVGGSGGLAAGRVGAGILLMKGRKCLATRENVVKLPCETYDGKLIRLCQRNLVAHPVEQTYLVQDFQLADVFGDGGLAHKEFLRGFRKAQVLGYAVKGFQTEIGHSNKNKVEGGNIKVLRSGLPVPVG